MENKKTKIIGLLKKKEGACYKFLLEHIDDLKSEDLDGLFVLLENKDKKRIKNIWEDKKKKLEEGLLKMRKLALGGALLCSKSKRKKQENILNKDLNK